MPDQSTTMKLRSASFTVREHADSAISEALKQVDDSKQWYGIAHTTSGARAIIRMTAQELIDSSKKSVDPNSVYEFRLWRVSTGDDQSLAQEIRWVAGVGCVELTLCTTDKHGSEAARCLYRPNKYLQHGVTLPMSTSASEMTSYEVFSAEDQYGNVVFVDELMTGEWT